MLAALQAPALFLQIERLINLGADLMSTKALASVSRGASEVELLVLWGLTVARSGSGRV